MKLAELGSTGVLEIFVFHRLVVGNGTKPFREASGPRLIPAHVPGWAKAAAKIHRLSTARTRILRMPLLLHAAAYWAEKSTVISQPPLPEHRLVALPFTLTLLMWRPSPGAARGSFA